MIKHIRMIFILNKKNDYGKIEARSMLIHFFIKKI